MPPRLLGLYYIKWYCGRKTSSVSDFRMVPGYDRDHVLCITLLLFY